MHPCNDADTAIINVCLLAERVNFVGAFHNRFEEYGDGKVIGQMAIK